jgi:hypothetical protein
MRGQVAEAFAQNQSGRSALVLSCGRGQPVNLRVVKPAGWQANQPARLRVGASEFPVSVDGASDSVLLSNAANGALGITPALLAALERSEELSLSGPAAARMAAADRTFEILGASAPISRLRQHCGASPPAAPARSTGNGPLTADEVRQLIGKDVTHRVAGGEDWSFRYKPDGTYDSGNRRIGDGGRYRIETDGRLCWSRQGNITGCFQYYRTAGALRVRGKSGDIGAVTVAPAPGPR